MYKKILILSLVVTANAIILPMVAEKFVLPNFDIYKDADQSSEQTKLEHLKAILAVFKADFKSTRLIYKQIESTEVSSNEAAQKQILLNMHKAITKKKTNFHFLVKTYNASKKIPADFFEYFCKSWKSFENNLNDFYRVEGDEFNTTKVENS